MVVIVSFRCSFFEAVQCWLSIRVLSGVWCLSVFSSSLSFLFDIECLLRLPLLCVRLCASVVRVRVGGLEVRKGSRVGRAGCHEETARGA